MIRATLRYHKEFLQANQEESRENQSLPSGSMTFIPPPLNKIKVNFDATVNKIRRVGAIAAIARNGQGQPYGWTYRQVKGTIDPLISESMACREAIFFVRACNFRWVIIEGDSRSIIEVLKNNSPPSSIRGIVGDIVHVLPIFEEVFFSFVYRYGNGAIHSLAACIIRDASFVNNPLLQFYFITSVMST